MKWRARATRSSQSWATICAARCRRWPIQAYSLPAPACCRRARRWTPRGAFSRLREDERHDPRSPGIYEDAARPRHPNLAASDEHERDLRACLGRNPGGASGEDVQARDVRRLHGQCDSDRLQQVLSNLLSNAVQHGRRGGRLRCQRMANRKSTVRVELRAADSRGPAQVIFNPLVQIPQEQSDDESDTSKPGTGVYIAHEIVTMHGGTMKAESSEATSRAMARHRRRALCARWCGDDTSTLIVRFAMWPPRSWPLRSARTRSARRSSSSIRRGRRTCRTTGSSAASRASRSTATRTSGSTTARTTSRTSSCTPSSIRRSRSAACARRR